MIDMEYRLLGPVPCRGCGQLVSYMMEGDRHLGWLHEGGSYRCPSLPAEEGRRPVLSGLVDRIMRALGLWTTCG